MTSPDTRCAIVVTSIAPPTESMMALAEGARNAGWRMICIGDAKSPARYELEGCDFIDLDAQRRDGYTLARSLPIGHYSRKNLGYLAAISDDAQVIVETDDDNAPLASFWDLQLEPVEAWAIEDHGWVNVYAYFTDQFIWPRGFPLEKIRHDRVLPELKSALVDRSCPVRQGLANGDTDVDAIYRLISGREVEFESRTPLVLDRGVWCPFNSQNTRWLEPAFDLMYLPSYCSFRMTDIWRSYVAQACLWANDWKVAFFAPSMVQVRNPHDLMQDFRNELDGYLNNPAIASKFDEVRLEPGAGSIPDNMRSCYRCLVDMGLIAPDELDLLDDWFRDLKTARTRVRP